MSFANEFLDLMTDTVTHAPMTGRDAYGKPSWGAAVSYACRVSYKHQKVSSARAGSQGEDVISTSQVIIPNELLITMDDKFTLPNGTTPLIQMWEIASDEKGPVYTRVFFSG